VFEKFIISIFSVIGVKKFISKIIVSRAIPIIIIEVQINIFTDKENISFDANDVT